MLIYYLNALETPEQVGLMTFIYRNYRNRMLNEAYRILGNKHGAEDAVHAVFSGLTENLTLIESVPEANRKAYLLTAVRNEALRIQREASGIVELDEGYDYGQKDDFSDILDREMDEYTFRKAKEAIASLGQKYSDILYMYYVNNMTVSEISERTGLKAENVRQRISRGMEAVRKILREENVI